MGTKLKNKYLSGILLVISIYLLGIASLSIFNIANNRSYIWKDKFFESDAYCENFNTYLNNFKIVFENENNISSEEKSEYNSSKKYMNSVKSIKYYIKNKETNEIYTNLPDKNNLDTYTKNNALYIEKFPRNTNTYNCFTSINQWFKSNNYEGEFIVLKEPAGYSQLIDDYKYFISIRSRIIKEIEILLISFVIAITLLIILFKNKDLFSEKIRMLYQKINIDIRILMFIVCTFFAWQYQHRVIFFYSPIDIGQGIKLTLVSAFMLYLVFNINEVFLLKSNHSDLKTQLKKSKAYKNIQVMNESKVIKKEKKKIRMVFILTLLLGPVICLAFVLIYSRETNLLIIPVLYILIYLLYVPPYVYKKIIYLKKIIDGTEEITSGNLNYFIEENGDKNLCGLAGNINNMKNGFKKSLESQVKSERLKSELITNVSHDLKTPLTSIINYTNILKNQNLSEEERKTYIDILDQKSQRLKILIEDLFEASKMASGTVEFHAEKVDIVALLKQVLGEFDEKIAKSSLTFKFNAESQNIYVNLDGNKTWRVFDNLINNVLKYSQANTRVYIDAAEQSEMVKITIKNISAYEMDFDVDEIFERFKRGDKARNTEGSGLGLAIAKSIVEQQDGKLNIEIDGDLFKVTIEFKKGLLH